MVSSEILKKIRKIVRSINLESKRIQKDHGVSIPQLLCLSFLNEEPNYQATHKQITAALELNSSTVTGIIDRLEKKAMVARLPRSDDRRSTIIALTSIGQKLLKTTPDLLHDRLAKSIGMLSKDEILRINTSLDLIIRHFGIETVDASPVIADGSHLDEE